MQFIGRKKLEWDDVYIHAGDIYITYNRRNQRHLQNFVDLVTGHLKSYGLSLEHEKCAMFEKFNNAGKLAKIIIDGKPIEHTSKINLCGFLVF
jgi:hypothetical protein